MVIMSACLAEQTSSILVVVAKFRMYSANIKNFLKTFYWKEKKKHILLFS